MHRWMALAMPSERIFVLYLASAFVIAFLSWLYYRKKEKDQRPEKVDQGFIAYLLDRDVFLHRSSIQDYWYFVINAVIYTGIISQLLISTHFFMMGFHHGFQGIFGIQEEAILPSSIWTVLLYTVVYTLLLDFAMFITHYAQHKIPILWEFHSVHHSAEALNPLTLYRMHPVDLFLAGIVGSILAGLGFAGFFYLTGEAPTALEVLGLNIIVFAFYLLGYNLRHSHIWIAYPQWLSHVFISPAQHQIHHSVEFKHWDKNMGLIFSFWDKLFGTLYVPKGYEKLTFGINKKKPNPYRNVWDMYFLPFKNAWKIIYPDSKAGQSAFIFVAVVLFCAFNYFVFFSLDKTIQEQNRPLASVHIEDLTWTEVQRSLDRASIDTIIIPSGGTEQNGPHLIIGKHNYVVRHNAEEIAKRLGMTLVAPVIAYVPEDFHMEWAGTVSVPKEVFEGVLEAAARSYLQHGFRNILFIGDSGDNQDSQQKIAEKLSAEFAEQDVNIIHVGNYYSGHGQVEWLESRGYTQEQIGSHAGIRDTAEIMHIHPEGLHRAPWIIPDRNTGANGDPTLANKRIGKEMTELKIKAALEQIRKETGKDGSGGNEATGTTVKLHEL